MTPPDESILCPFTILVDSNESQPFTFSGLRANADQDNRPLVVQTEWRALGRHPDSLGDYSIDGFTGRVHVERKSVEDCQSTILGWETQHQRENGKPGRRDRFESELANLSEIEAPLIVVEGTLGEVTQTVESYGKKSAKQNAKSLFRSILAYQMDFLVPWVFADGRRLAEIVTFRFLERFWRHHRKEIESDS